MVDLSLPMRGQVEDHDVLLTYPYESMTPLLRLVREASSDDACISIKIHALPRGKSSHLCESLISAAEAGKDVTVLMELRARFDEANNIAWAERLEDAGCTVIYGSEGFKCHSKICQITYHDRDGISRITCLGTGNFNEKTATLYSDFMYLTADEGIGADGNTFFRNLSLGNLRGSYKHLGVAPVGLKPLVMRGLDREISRARAGEPAKVFLKMNSLTDRDRHRQDLRGLRGGRPRGHDRARHLLHQGGRPRARPTGSWSARSRAASWSTRASTPLARTWTRSTSRART